MRKLWSLGGLSGRELLVRTWRESWEDEVFGQAGRLAFYHFLYIFPCLLLMFFVLANFPPAEAQLRNALLDTLRHLLPQQCFALMQSMIQQLEQAADSRIAVWSASLSAIWAGVNGIWAIMTGLNIAYEVREERPLWKQLGIAFALAVALAILFLLALTLVAYAARFVPRLSLPIEWLAIVALLMLCFSLLYRFAPSVAGARWRWSTPGAMAAAILWLTAAGLMRLYSAYFHSYAIIYRQLNGAVTMLLWFYFTSAAVLIGGEMNSEIEKAARRQDGAAKEAREGS